jgi:hypothetical protein
MKSLADTTFFYFDMVVEYQYGDTMESNFEYLDKDFLNMNTHSFITTIHG